MEITRKEFNRIKDLKELDFEICDFRHVNILNLGRKSWGKFYCRSCEKEHVLCPELCYKVALNILGCQLYSEVPRVKPPRPVKPNKSYDLAKCFLCSKELRGASKKGVIKNRNNPSFWGVESEWKILCLGCLEKRFYGKMVEWQRKKFREYLRRGYE